MFNLHSGDEQIARLASSLMVRTDIPPLTEAYLDGCVIRISAEKKRKTLDALHTRVLSGDLKRDNPEYQVYLDLKRQKHL